MKGTGKNRPGQVHLTKAEQLIAAIEHLALGLEYVIRRKQLSVGELAHWQESMRTSDQMAGEKNEWGLERKYANYRKVFEHFGLPIKVDWQMGIAQGWEKPEVFRRLLSTYLKHAGWGYSDAALGLLLRNSPLGTDLLFVIVVLHFAVAHSLPVAFRYRKFFLMRETDREAVPLAILVDRDQFYLVAREIDSQTEKQFMLSRVIALQSDLHGDFRKALMNGSLQRTSFNPASYLRSENANFRRVPVAYQIWMFGNTYDHFRHTSTLEHRVLEGSPRRCLVEVRSVDQDEILQLAFRYGQWCRLEAPKGAVQDLTEKLSALASAYH